MEHRVSALITVSLYLVSIKLHKMLCPMYHYSHNLGGILNFDATSLSNSKNVWKFDPDLEQWVPAKALQTARGSHAVSLFNVSMLNPELCPVCASGQCLQSPNYPRHYGNNQDKVHLYGLSLRDLLDLCYL